MNLETKYKCIIWETPLDLFSPQKHLSPQNPQGHQPYFKILSNHGDKYEIYNPKAGGKYIVGKILGKCSEIPSFKFKILDPDTNFERELNDEEKVRLSGYIAQENLKGVIPNLSSIKEGDNWFSKLPSILNPSKRAYLLLEALVKRTDVIGKEFCIHVDRQDDSVFKFYHPHDEIFYSISYSKTEKEMKYLFNYLAQINFIEQTYHTSILKKYQVTVKGFEKINNVSNIDSQIGFIAMWIHSCMNALYEHLEKAIRKAGYQPLRIDNKEHINKIDDEILVEINKSRFMICDLSSEKEKQRGSVYFEAGYALGKNTPIIWTCNKEQEKEIPFDIRQYNCLFWIKNELDDFSKKLQHRIENVIGKGPVKGD